ncbi:MAG: terminase family protein [Tannerella sp.]|nr:terminase family protein [Tannerella sp.]
MARKVQAFECTRDLFYFLKTFWSVIIREEPVFNWHIPYLCNELQMLGECIIRREEKPYDLIVNVPPGSTKSTVATIMFPAWLWANDPTLRIISNSYSTDLSEDHASKSRDIVMSELYRLLFPHVEIRHDSSGKSKYDTTQGGERRATSTSGGITGKHAHVIINDDPQDPRQAESEAYRRQAIERTKTLSSRKVNKRNTPMITIMQRLHDEDVTGYLLKRKGETIRHICLPAELSDNVSPDELKKNYRNGLLDPARIGREVIAEARIDLGSRGYAGQYGQNPVADGGNIVKREWFGKIPLAHFEAMRGHTPIHFFLDTAYDEKKESDNDPSGIIAVCKIQGKLYVYNGQKVYKEFPELCRFIVQYVKAYGYTGQSTVRIEPKANGVSIVQQLRRQTKLNVTRGQSPVDSKMVRLTAQSAKIECGRVVLVEGVWNDGFLDEVCGFPAKKHDEYVDVLCYAMSYFLDDNEYSPEELEELEYISNML